MQTYPSIVEGGAIVYFALTVGAFAAIIGLILSTVIKRLDKKWYGD